MITIKDPIHFLHSYCMFEDSCVWILTGISRNKDNTPESKSFLRRLVLVKPDDVQTCYQEIKTLTNDANTIYRMYVSLNSRNVINALFNMQKKLIEIGMGLAKGQDDALQLSKKVGSLWKTELAQKSCRGTKRFLIDFDSQDKVELEGVLAWCEDHTEIIALRETVTGYHIVINACDTRDLLKRHKHIDLQRDSMVFIESWEGTE